MFIQLKNIRLFYEKAGHGDPILLIHGNSESHLLFKKTMEELSKTHTVYVLDMRSHGQSDSVTEMHYFSMAYDIKEFIVKLKLQKPYFFGFSDGGIVGLILASLYPNLFKRMLIGGANSNPEGLKKRWLVYYKCLYFITRNKLLKLMLTEPHLEEEDLFKITCPTILVYAKHDVVKKNDGQFLASNLPHSKLIILPFGTHSSYVKNSKKLTELILKYLLKD